MEYWSLDLSNHADYCGAALQMRKLKGGHSPSTHMATAQVSMGGFIKDTRVFWATNMFRRPDVMLPQPHHHLKKHVTMLTLCNADCTKLQHVDTHAAVFAHVASRLATTDYHRSTRTVRASQSELASKKATKVSSSALTQIFWLISEARLQLQNIAWWWPVARAKRG